MNISLNEFEMICIGFAIGYVANSLLFILLVLIEDEFRKYRVRKYYNLFSKEEIQGVIRYKLLIEK